jgi:putative hemolysin
VTVPGAFPVHDLKDLGIDLPSGDYATVAGLVLDRLGRVPDGPGESVTIERWRLVVTSVSGHAITGVQVCSTRAGAREDLDHDDEVGVP